MASLHQRNLGIVVLSDAKWEMEVPRLTGIHNDGSNVCALHAEGRVKAPVLSFMSAQKNHEFTNRRNSKDIGPRCELIYL